MVTGRWLENQCCDVRLRARVPPGEAVPAACWLSPIQNVEIQSWMMALPNIRSRSQTVRRPTAIPAVIYSASSPRASVGAGHVCEKGVP